MTKREIRAFHETIVIGSEQGDFRPILILSHNIFNDRSGTVIAVAITSQPQRAGFLLTLELSDKKLSQKSWAKISQVRTLSTKRIGKKIPSASPEELVSIIDGLNPYGSYSPPLGAI